MSHTYRQYTTSEELVYQALCQIVESAETFLGMRIVTFRQAEHHSWLDRHKVDFDVCLERIDRPGEIVRVPLQVVSKEHKRRKFERTLNRLGLQYIQVVLVRFGESLGKVVRDVADSLRTGINAIRRQLNAYIHDYREHLRQAFDDMATARAVARRDGHGRTVHHHWCPRFEAARMCRC